MKSICNVKRVFIDEDFDFLVGLLCDIKNDPYTHFISTDEDHIVHSSELQIIGHRIYTHPQNPTINVLEVDYVNKVDTSTPTEKVESSNNVPTSSGDSK